LAGVTAFLAAFNVQTQLVKRIFSTSYSNIYSAFQRDAVDQIQIYYDHFGFAIVTLTIVGLSVAAFQRRSQPWFFASVAIFTGILFSRVHAPDRHHILPVALFLFPAYFEGLSFIAKRLMAPPVGYAMMGVVACTNFVSTFVPLGWGLAEPLRMAAPRVNYAPLHLEHYDEYKRLAVDLKNLGPKTKISVYAASFMLTYDMLGSIEPAVAQSIPIFPTVDLRDGFWWHTLANEYAVIGDPTPLADLRPGSQRVIEYPAQSIRSGTGIGAAFMDTGKVYQLDNGVKAYLYKRIRPVTAAEISDLANRFYKDYPDWRDKKNEDVGFGMASAFIESGDIKGQVEKVAPTAIIIRPGETQPTSVTFRLDEWFRPSKFTIEIVDKEGRRCSDEERLSFEFSSDGVEASSHVVAGRRPATMEVPPGGRLKITVPPKSNSNCTTAFIIFGFNEDGK